VDENAAAVERLRALYPRVPLEQVRECVMRAAQTVTRQLGSPDPVVAEALAQLRLDVRAQLRAS
jgi:hypothetical protein